MLEVRSYSMWYRVGEDGIPVKEPSFRAEVHCTLCGQSANASSQDTSLTFRCCRLWCISGPLVAEAKVLTPEEKWVLLDDAEDVTYAKDFGYDSVLKRGVPFCFHVGEDPLGDVSPPHEYILASVPSQWPYDHTKCLVVERRTGEVMEVPFEGLEVRILEAAPAEVSWEQCPNQKAHPEGDHNASLQRREDGSAFCFSCGHRIPATPLLDSEWGPDSGPVLNPGGREPDSVSGGSK